MKITRTDSRKFKFSKLTWSDYCQIIKMLDKMVNVYSISSQTDKRIMGLVLYRLQRRLAKADTYPLHDTYYQKAKLSITLEAEEALTLWHLYPEDLTDPVRTVLNLEIPKYF